MIIEQFKTYRARFQPRTEWPLKPGLDVHVGKVYTWKPLWCWEADEPGLQPSSRPGAWAMQPQDWFDYDFLWTSSDDLVFEGEVMQ